jgi:prolyl-tRNA synthetase
MKPRFGLIRAKEFLMKDLYTFDVDLAAATETYELVNQQYVKIFEHLRIPFVKIAADTGVMGGKTSHEYHILTSIGEDQIVTCSACQRAVNKELCGSERKICEKCTSEGLQHQQGIEIGHTFILGDKYSKVLKATFLSKAGKPVPLQMGCYGIGVTRVIAACIEHLSSDEQIRWPAALAPFTTCIIPPKEGSKEESAVAHLTQEIYQQLDDAVVDDRTSMTIGKRLMEAKKLGIPNIIVIGAKAAETEPKVELITDDSSRDLSTSDAINALKENKVGLS